MVTLTTMPQCKNLLFFIWHHKKFSWKRLFLHTLENLKFLNFEKSHILTTQIKIAGDMTTTVTGFWHLIKCKASRTAGLICAKTINISHTSCLSFRLMATICTRDYVKKKGGGGRTRAQRNKHTQNLCGTWEATCLLVHLQCPHQYDASKPQYIHMYKEPPCEVLLSTKPSRRRKSKSQVP